MAESLAIEVADGQTVSALQTPAHNPFALLVMAHGAGAGMTHPFMAAVAAGLAARGVSTLRYQFPYMEAGSKRVDRPEIAHATVRAAVNQAAGGLPLFAGGKSFGARMTSQAQAIGALPGVRGLVFFGFPLHPAKRPATVRADHLADVRVPILFLQGAKDALADIALLQDVAKRLGSGATLRLFPEADHSFHVPKRTGQTDDQVMEILLDEAVGWMRRQLE